jgi:hypothetical protein
MINRINFQEVYEPEKCDPKRHTSYCIDYEKSYCQKTCDYAIELQGKLEKETRGDLR